MEAFAYGLLMALGLILPLGVQNLYVLTQGMLQPSLLKGLPTSITASLSDTFLILLSVTGLNAVIAAVPELAIVMNVAGILFLWYMGYRAWQSEAFSGAGNSAGDATVKKQILFTLSVSLLNPHAIIDTLSVIGASSLHYEGREQLLFLSACILVSWLWFHGLLLLGRIVVHSNRTRGWFNYLNQLSALLLWGSSLLLLRNLLS
ncbi:LysE family transporter [Paenibacillus oenotherae]|uniref:LysE family transporter n=1 Tax=Paenibacillus oenotherae TaxID=1435645 RepID=A0ABS7D391_9BACL|nr:LysE family transporter [Paenibacillus oenotherae]MBW7474281.1 LysE family transporter [Paenibacillus oenotherae]